MAEMFFWPLLIGVLVVLAVLAVFYFSEFPD